MVYIDAITKNINLKKLIDYFTENPEDSDNLQSISISIDSPSIRKAMAAPDKIFFFKSIEMLSNAS